MPAIPNAKMTAWADLDALNTTNVNAYLRDPLRFLLLPPQCRVRQSSAQTLTNNTWTDVTFTVEDIDTDVDGIGGHSTVSNTGRFTARYPGRYACDSMVSIATNTTGVRGLRWSVNGTTVPGSEVAIAPVAGSPTRLPARSISIELLEGDYVTIQAFQTSGAGLATFVSSDAASSMDIRWATARVGDV